MVIVGVINGTVAGDYAISAIWSNLELFLGIIAANIAISPSIYSFLRRGNGRSNASDYGSTRIRLGYLKQMKLRGDTTADMTSTIIRCPSASRSDGSEVPIGSTIRKTTDFRVVEEC